MEKKELNLENVIEFINTCEAEDFKQIKSSDRINIHIKIIKQRYLDDIDDLNEEISELKDEIEPSYESTIDFIQSASDIELNGIKQEIADYLNEPSFVSNNLYDYDKMKILSTAFDKYSLDELMEKLQINWLQVF